MRYEEKVRIWDRKMLDAIAEIQRLISRSFPGTGYIQSLQDDPFGMRMVATVDTDDLDAVVDCFIDRLLSMQVDEGIPLYVVPIRRDKQRVTHSQPSDVWSPGMYS